MRSGKGGTWSTTKSNSRSSQWSLTFEVRKRPASDSESGQEAQSQWSLTFEVRKRDDRDLDDAVTL